jgi:predicted amidohydrolase
MRIAAIQLRIDDSVPEARLAVVLDAIGAEAKRGADLVLLPEMWYPGYFGFDVYGQVAESLDGPLMQQLGQAAAAAGVHLLGGSVVESAPEGLFNTSVLFDRTGQLVATYRKMHLFPYGSKEHELLVGGSEVVVSEIEGVAVGLTTCYDLRFPELYRAMVDKGAELFLVVAGWPVPRLDAWRTLGRSRAIENQAGIVACNSSGRQDGATYLGVSYAFDAWGTSLGELDDREGVLRVEIDPASIRAARDDFPALKSRVMGIEGNA